MTELPERVYTEHDLARARRTGKLIGWIQGGAVVVGGAFVLNLIGWIPTLVGIGIVGYVGYRLVAGAAGKSRSGEES